VATTQSAANIYREVHTLEDIRQINKTIRGEMEKVTDQEHLTELKKRSDYLCTLTLSPSWGKRFGRKSSRFLQVARAEDERTTKLATEIALRRGFDVEYHAWRGG
jgi:hypothetical protein